MISYSVDDVKHFMNQLLRTPLFDEWELREVRLHTLCRYVINGAVNTAYLTDDEKSAREGSYLEWRELRPTLTNLIKGKKSPSLFQVTLAYPLIHIQDIQTEPLESLLLNIHFEGGHLQLITATSLKHFSLDRSYEQYWDSFLPRFCSEHGVIIHPTE